MTLEFAFGEPAGGSNGGIEMSLPLLAGEPREPIAGPVEPAGASDGLALWRGPHVLAGFAKSTPGMDLESETRRLYGRILHETRGLRLYRIWNLVPHINESSAGGLENYQAFCRGRSLAFEHALGRGFPENLPAASAVGIRSDALTVAFLAGDHATQNFENPAQVPAYDYPPEHGPRAPSFARATVVDSGGPRLDVFISGTSAIVGHSTVAPNDTLRQLECTLDNLALISKACRLGERLGAGASRGRHFKVYLRAAGDLPAVSARLQRTLLAPGDRVTYLGAAICRSSLNVEIEATVRGALRN